MGGCNAIRCDCALRRRHPTVVELVDPAVHRAARTGTQRGRPAPHSRAALHLSPDPQFQRGGRRHGKGALVGGSRIGAADLRRRRRSHGGRDHRRPRLRGPVHRDHRSGGILATLSYRFRRYATAAHKEFRGNPDHVRGSDPHRAGERRRDFATSSSMARRTCISTLSPRPAAGTASPPRPPHLSPPPRVSLSKP